MPQTPLEMVQEFHAAFYLPLRDFPAMPDRTERELRAKLLVEETRETVHELLAGVAVDRLARELADVVYVAYGTAAQFGINLDAVVAEVHRANMEKLGPDGKPILRDDGKVLKPPGWKPPDIVGAMY